MTDPDGRPSRTPNPALDARESEAVPGDRDHGGASRSRGEIAVDPRTSGGATRGGRDAPIPAFLERVRSAPARVVRPGGGRERVTAPMAVAAVCPFLASPDGQYRAAAVSRDHRCGAVDPPVRLPVDKQQQLCLRTRHFECPAFVAATAPSVALTASRPVPRSSPLVLERAEPTLSVAGLQVPARGIQFALASVLLIALAIVVLGGGDRGVPAGVFGPSASPGGSSFARATATPRRTTSPGSSAGTTRTPSASPATASSPAPSKVDATHPAGPTRAPTATDSPDPGASSAPKPTAGRTAAASVSAGATPAPSGEVASNRTYKVKRGDTLSAIAHRFGTTVKVLQELNNIQDPQYIRVGQILKLP